MPTLTVVSFRLREAFDCLYRSPIDDPNWVLAIGTGGRQWSLIVGDEYPQAAVYMFDITPDDSWTSPNVEFSWLECWQCLDDESNNTYDLIRMGNFAG